MRLIDTQALVEQGSAKLVEYIDERALPPFAILSHTWGRPEEEILFEDVASSPIAAQRPPGFDPAYFYSPVEIAKRNEKAGWFKVHRAARRAYIDGFEHLWIDTCCIDKRSSAELSEAINPMYRWYQKAAVCYVHLDDYTQERDWESNFVEDSGANAGTSAVTDAGGKIFVDLRFKLSEEVIVELGKCRWFTRGWTLQELIAPRKVLFFDRRWKFVFAKAYDTTEALSPITGIVAKALNDNSRVHDFSVAQRMYWASRRNTTRVEDEAYCLLGIFDINMPLLYGKGPRAFRRLQEAIIAVSTDASIFAWELRPHQETQHGHDLLAPSAANFWWQANDIVCLLGRSRDLRSSFEYRLTNRGVGVPCGINKRRRDQQCDVVFADIGCTLHSSGNTLTVGLRVKNKSPSKDSDISVTHVTPELVSTSESTPRSYRGLILIESAMTAIDPEIGSLLIDVSQIWQDTPRYPGLSMQGNTRVCVRLPEPGNPLTWRVLDVFPHSEWHAATRSFMFSLADGAAHGMVLVELTPGVNFLVIIVVINQTMSRLAGHGRVGKGYLQYWVLPWNTRARLRLMETRVIEIYLASLASKHLYELHGRRQHACKTVNLLQDGSIRIKTSAFPDFDNGTQTGTVVYDAPALTRLISGCTKEDFPRHEWRFLDIDLYLTIETHGDQEPLSIQSGHPQLNSLRAQRPHLENVMSVKYIRTWLRSHMNAPSHETVCTQAWYFQQPQDPPMGSYLWLRLVDLKTAIYDRKLWSKEAAWAQEHPLPRREEQVTRV